MHHDIRKDIEKIVFRALSNGAIRVLLKCSGAETFRFLMLHSKRIILYVQGLSFAPRRFGVLTGGRGASWVGGLRGAQRVGNVG